MTEDHTTTPLFYAERQAQLACWPASVQQALHASAGAAEHTVHGVRLGALRALLGVMLQSKLGTAAVADIDLSAAPKARLDLMPKETDGFLLEIMGATSIEAVLRALQNRQTQGHCD